MTYTVNHIHLKGPDPRKTAQWYVENLGAKITYESDVRGALRIRLDIGGTQINVSGPRPGEKPGKGDAGIHYGIEHIGVITPDLAGDLDKLADKGVKILEPMSEFRGVRIAFIQAPDDVRIELRQKGT